MQLLSLHVYLGTIQCPGIQVQQHCSSTVSTTLWWLQLLHLLSLVIGSLRRRVGFFLGGGGAEPQKAEGLLRSMRHATAQRTRACTPWLRMLRPLACYRHSVTLRTAAQGTLRHHMHAHVLVALAVPCVPVVHVATLPVLTHRYMLCMYTCTLCTSLRSLCLRTGTCSACTRAPCALVATLPRAVSMLRPLACSLHECLQANGVSLLATDTQACCAAPPAGGQQQLRGHVGSKALHTYAPLTLSMCMLWSTSGARRMHSWLLLRHSLCASVGPCCSISLRFPLWGTPLGPSRPPGHPGSGPRRGLRRRRGAWRGPKLEVNRGYAIPYYISRARAGRRPTAGLEKKRGPDRGVWGSSEHLNTPFTLKVPNMTPFGPFFAPFCPLLNPIIEGDVEHMHMLCISPRIPL